MGSGPSQEQAPPVELTYASHLVQGRRPYQEDRISIQHPNPALRKVANHTSYFAIFDGHGGSWAAEYCLDNLHKVIANEKGYCSKHPTKVEGALGRAFLKCDTALLKEARAAGEEAGSTVAVCLIDHEYIYAANTGDTRIVLCRNYRGRNLTIDHKPSDPLEMKRVLNAGGRVPYKYAELGDRGLAVSRAFGDRYFKDNNKLKPHEQVIVCDPYICRTKRMPQDQFVLVASDGLWAVMQAQGACDFIIACRRAGHSLERTCELLTQHALDLRSTDNVSVVIIEFGATGQTYSDAPAAASPFSQYLNNGVTPAPPNASASIVAVPITAGSPSPSPSPSPEMTEAELDVSRPPSGSIYDAHVHGPHSNGHVNGNANGLDDQQLLALNEGSVLNREAFLSRAVPQLHSLQLDPNVALNEGSVIGRDSFLARAARDGLQVDLSDLAKPKSGPLPSSGPVASAAVAAPASGVGGGAVLPIAAAKTLTSEHKGHQKTKTSLLANFEPVQEGEVQDDDDDDDDDKKPKPQLRVALSATPSHVPPSASASPSAPASASASPQSDDGVRFHF